MLKTLFGTHRGQQRREHWRRRGQGCSPGRRHDRGEWARTSSPQSLLSCTRPVNSRSEEIDALLLCCGLHAVQSKPLLSLLATDRRSIPYLKVITREIFRASQVEWEGAGQQPGLEIWRVENKQGSFGIKRLPKVVPRPPALANLFPCWIQNADPCVWTEAGSIWIVFPRGLLHLHAHQGEE